MPRADLLPPGRASGDDRRQRERRVRLLAGARADVLAPSGWLHGFENLGGAEAELILAFSHGSPSDASLQATFGSPSDAVLGNTFGLPAATSGIGVDALPAFPPVGGDPLVIAEVDPAQRRWPPARTPGL